MRKVQPEAVFIIIVISNTNPENLAYALITALSGSPRPNLASVLITEFTGRLAMAQDYSNIVF